MHIAKVGTFTSFAKDDPFFQTTPSAIDADIEAFCLELGGLKPTFVPVRPAPKAETGMCHSNVTEQVLREGGSLVNGWAIWINRLFVMAEFHAIWITPTCEAVDVTPPAEGETRVLFAEDPAYPPSFDFNRRPQNRAMRTIGRPDSVTVLKAIAALPPTRRAYEEGRATKKSMDLASYIASKMVPSELASAVDDLIISRALLDRLFIPTTSGVYSPDPESFLKVQAKIARRDRSGAGGAPNGARPR
jgi:hypothetical protein